MKRLWYFLGILSPAVFFLTLLIFENSTSGYNPQYQAVSDLGKQGAQHSSAMNLFGFKIPGMLLMLFGVKLLTVSTRKVFKLISALLVLAGVGWTGIGLFPNYQDKTSVYHVISTYLSGGSIATAAILLSREKRVRRGLRNFSLAVGIFLLTRVITGPLFLELENYRGLVQRVYLTAFWLSIITVTIAFLSKTWIKRWT